MKDSSVSPAGLFDPKRQKRLLEGLATRFRDCLDQQQVLRATHAQQRVEEESRLSSQRQDQTEKCRRQRREMLEQWDAAEEQLTSEYESAALDHRRHLNRLAAIYRRKAADAKASVHKKAEARRQAVVTQYDNRKNQPGLQNRKEIKRIDDSLAKMHEFVESSRALTIRRLDGLPEVPPQTDEESISVETPTSVDEAIKSIEGLTRQCESVMDSLHAGFASKTNESILMPSLIAASIVLWSVGAFFLGPQPPYIVMGVGALVCGVVGFIAMEAVRWPLKKTTRQLYPQVEHLARAAEECATQGRALSSKAASEAAAKLLHRRNDQLTATDKWQEEHQAELEKKLQLEQETQRQTLLRTLSESDTKYGEDSVAIGNRMRHVAEELAGEITSTLAETDRALQEERDTAAQSRAQQLKRLSQRLQEGASRGLGRIVMSDSRVDERFPEWGDVLAGKAPHQPNVDFLPLGWLGVQQSLRSVLAQSVHSGADGNGQSDDMSRLIEDAEIPDRLPVVLHRRLHSGVILSAARDKMNQAIDLAHQILWRLITAAPPSRAKLTLIDPLGRGQHFTSFMALGDHDPAMVGHRVWTTDSKIDARLGELAHHVEDVLQASLRDRFQRIEDYNAVAGSMAEPYRAVVAVGLPEGLTRDGYKHLRALVESGLRCGIFTILVCDADKPWPSDMPLPRSDKMLRLAIDDQGQWRFDSDGLEGLPFQPAASPPIPMRADLIDKVGSDTVAASRVEIPLDSILPADDAGEGSTGDGIDIVIGSQGANRSLSLDLGEGVRQHVLIAGKTGSGKSTLLHSLITSGAHHYRPDQLQFYLLDFKKGVEFKPYADARLPHARVIGIESEREFGRSVLQRLDEELQHRGEQFRAQGVQELDEYRRESGNEMPRIMLVIDEFQELFVRDDRLAGDCAMLLDRLVRQGRSFGMHVVLSSQSLAGAYSLPRATLGQMAIRIAMQCSESDAALILSDDNTAARLISRPGEAIYNDAGGLLEGNQPFQVAWLTGTRHREMLAEIASRDEAMQASLPPAVVFEGNRPCQWTTSLADAGTQTEGGNSMAGLLGESVEIGPPTSLQLARDTGRNVLLIAPGTSRGAILASTLSGWAKSSPKLQVVYLDGNRADDAPSLAPWLAESGMNVKSLRPRDSEAEMIRLSEVVRERGDDAEDCDPIIVVVDPLERFRDYRQDESFNFSLDAAGGGETGAAALQAVLRDGPSANVFVIMVCGSAETLSRWLPRASQHDLELRILGRMNASDSSTLIDSPVASDLSAATMLVYDDTDGRIVKFRQCNLPEAEAVKEWLFS